MGALRAVAVAAVFVVTACGGGTDDADTSDRTPSSAVPTTVTTGSSTPDGVTAAPGPGADGPTGQPGDSGAEAAQPGEGVRGVEGDAPAGERADASVYTPPAGEYVYDATGHVETTGLTNSREPAPPRSTDHVTVTRGRGDATRMTVVTRDEGSDSSQEVVIDVTDREARLVRLGYRPDSGVAYSVAPDPPALVARLPYRSGDSWDIAWNDPSIGISGVGTGTVVGRETITTPAGTFDVIVITVEQRLRGTIEGTLTVTSWLDPATGIQAKQHLISEFRDATGANRSDVTRTLRRHPG